ncbi:hypothetical protein AB0C51_05080 [Streptomyces pathocidini]|uniref:hypothetical protein n=1 Tax=Streptomyces pathocidini TaxID=1650571 RepID=UPI0033FB6D2B
MTGLEKAVTLAGLSGDSKIQHRIWGHASMLAMQRRRYTDAVAAVEAAKNLSVSRRDPLFGSLTYARAAGTYSEAGEPAAALRNLGAAERAFERVDFAEERPSWMGFFDRAELEGLSALVRLDLGDFDVAESHLHRTLSLLRPDMLRNRAYYTAKLSFAQLGQGDVELATATMASVPSISPTAANSGRVRKLMDAFGKELGRVASGSSLHREWLDRNRKVSS